MVWASFVVMVVDMGVVMLMVVSRQVASRCSCLEMGMDAVCCSVSVLLRVSLGRFA